MYLVCLVVVLWVVLVDFRLLRVVEVAGQVVYTASELLSPFCSVDEPTLD